MPRLTKRARKDLEALPSPLQDKARTVVKRLDDEPALGRKLLGKLAGMRSARLGRSHRILYETTDENVVILTISDRKDVYK